MATQLKDPVLFEDRLHTFVGKVVDDFGGFYTSTLAYLGDRLGIYEALSDSEVYSSESLAHKTGLTERYLREWLLHMAAAGYVVHTGGGNYYMPAEQATALTDESSPFFVAGGFQIMTAMAQATERIAECFRTGEGMPWGEHHHDLFEGTERFFRPSYTAFLISQWLPALDGVVSKLEQGAVVADVGCGHGASTIVMAERFGESRFYGFDNHGASIERAREITSQKGFSDRVSFDVADCTSFPDNRYDLIAFFDCFHDLADPEGAARRAAETLKDDGTVMIVEPMAGETIDDNLNPIGRVFSGASVLCCTPNALSGGNVALGTVASDSKLREVVEAGGLTGFKRVTETPFSRVFEARKRSKS